MSALRKQLGGTPQGQQYVETVGKKGYRFGVSVSHVPGNDNAEAAVSIVSLEKTEQEVLLS
jgi:DNA-binding winged helix-turn-helix (wHTH) protein